MKNSGQILQQTNQMRKCAQKIVIIFILHNKVRNMRILATKVALYNK